MQIGPHVSRALISDVPHLLSLLMTSEPDVGLAVFVGDDEPGIDVVGIDDGIADVGFCDGDLVVIVVVDIVGDDEPGFDVVGIDDGIDDVGFRDVGCKVDGFDDVGFDDVGTRDVGFKVEGIDDVGFDDVGFNVVGFDDVGFDDVSGDDVVVGCGGRPDEHPAVLLTSATTASLHNPLLS